MAVGAEDKYAAYVSKDAYKTMSATGGYVGLTFEFDEVKGMYGIVSRENDFPRDVHEGLEELLNVE